MMRILFSKLIIAGFVWGESAAAQNTFGHCAFATSTLSFRGSDKEQAKCLLTKVNKWGRLAATPAKLPETLDRLIGTTNVVSPAKMKAYLGRSQIAVGNMDAPVSRAYSGARRAPSARYFVIHDTSSPWFGDRSFPTDLNTNPRVNNLKVYERADAVAHFFVDRRGRSMMGHDFSIPWRATKLENKVIGTPAKGLFLHIENVQPRRRDASGGPMNDAIAPQPGLTPAQYDTLAHLYVAASSRAGRWLIPAFHAVIDHGISDAHDDPQNFDLAAFDAAVRKVIDNVR